MARRALFRILIGLALTIVGAIRSRGDTLVSGTISTNTTWTLANSPYVVTGTVTVDAAANPTLTIQAGVTVKFNSSTALIIGLSGSNTGALQAVGTSGQPIMFTANTASPTAGYWQGLFFQNCSGASNLSYATVQYGGSNSLFRAGIQVGGTCSPALANVVSQNNTFAGGWIAGGSSTVSNSTFSSNPVGLNVSNASPTLQSVTISANSGTGLWIGSPGAPSLQTVTISNNTGVAMQIDPAVTLASVSGLTLSGNGTNLVQLYGSAVGVSTTWKATGYPYNVPSYITVSGASVLTIQPDVTMKFDASGGLAIGSGATLQAVGTPGHLITFTSSSATPSAGAWSGLSFGVGSLASHLSYALVAYGQYVLANGSVAIDNTTIQYHYQGLYAAVSGSSLSLSTVTLTNNTGAAIQMKPNVTFGSVTGLTVSGNGMDAVSVLAGTVDVNARWTNIGLPYIVTAVVNVSGPLATSPIPVLTIDPLVTLKFNSTVYLQIGSPYAGRLQAVGTAAQPITFTANSVSPTAGFWGGLRINLDGPTSSTISYATVSYPTTGLTVLFGTPTLDHVTLSNGSQYGVSTSASAPTIRNCSFVANSFGGIYGPGDARLNWWSAASGPSGIGPGTGQSVLSAGTSYEPWLTAAPSTPQYFASATITNPTFNPTQSIFSTTAFSTQQSGNWTVTVTNSGQVQVRQFTGSGTTAAPIWDGKNAGGVDQPNGNYTYVFASTAGSNVATPATGRLVINNALALALTGVALDNAFFSPNGDGIKDTATVSGNANYTINWTTLVKNSGGTTVRTLTGSGTTLVATWNGKNDSNVLQPDASYTLNTTATAGTASVNDVRTTTIDTTVPVAAIASPAAGTTLSNIYTNGVTTVPVTGTATDINLKNWALEWGAGSSPTIWNPVTGGSTGVSGAQLGTAWATVSLTNGTYTLRLTVNDNAGNVTAVTRQVTVGNFSLTASSSSPINAVAGQTIYLGSVVPFTVTETLVFKNQAGTVVRTLFNGSRNAGIYNDTWNGRNQAGTILPDDAYLWSATITAGTYTLTWDQSTSYLSAFQYMYPPLVNFDPFNNNPLAISYNFSYTGRVTIVFDRDGTGLITHDCNFPRYCLVNSKYEESGAHTVYWSGTDSTGALRGDLTRVAVSTDQYLFSKNAVVQFGSKPTITSPRVTPPLLGPALGSQNITFTLGTYQSQPAAVTVTILNQSSVSVLRTITVPSQAAGAVTIVWDGRADNGMLVAPGFYTITVAITDSLGNTLTGRVLTTVQY